MSNSEQSWHEQAEAQSPNVGELKSLLNTIVAQLSDADKRHSASLEELQTRVVAMGRDARSIRHRVPPQFRPAFERIEAGVDEIAHRIAEAAAEAEVEHAAPGRASEGASPVALRSARPAGEAEAKKRDDETPRRQKDVDTFDVIETSLPGNVSDPWDRAAAEALSSHYESAGFGRKPAAARAAHANIESVIDSAWLDERFASIAKGIEQSLSEVRPDQGFQALGQRFDHFEQQFSSLASNVATQSDLDALRLVEAQVGEVANQLLRAQDQLSRLGVIEDQLTTISAALAEVHQAATAPMEADHAAPERVHAPVDADAIAHAAAEQVAARFAGLMQPGASGDHELRPLIEQFMSESRQGEENTTALLDTMQQAMIRLLDRVDAIEFTQHQAVTANPAPQEYVREQVRFAEQGGRGTAPGFADPDDDVMNAAAAAVASAKAIAPVAEAIVEFDPPPLQSQARASRAPEKSRQDFIAEARRAKLRLAAFEPDAEAVVIPAPVAAEAPVRAASSPSRPVRPAPASTVKTGPSAPSPRLIAMAVAALVAVGGLWMSLGGEKPSAVKPVALSPPAAQSSATQSDADGAPGQVIDDPEIGSTAPHSDGIGPRSDAGPSIGSQSSTLASAADRPARTTLPMVGVAVDLDRPMSAEELAQARRHEAMASMSGVLGAAAARSSADTPTPAVLLPKDGDLVPTPSSFKRQSAAPSALQQQISQSTESPARSEMPAASVGPLSLRLAAANGDPSAQFEVGARFAEGKGTKQSFKDAAKWYQRSADQNLAQAQYRLGTLYERGLGLRADAAQAAAWYQKAAEQGNVKAMHNLAVLSANQSGQSPDYITASQWFEKAADRGLADSQFNLAILYENGLGVKADMKQAYVWLALAARGGDKEAVKRRDIIRGKLSADELRAADRAVATWRPVPTNKQVNDSRLAGEAWKKNPKNGVSG